QSILTGAVIGIPIVMLVIQFLISRCTFWKMKHFYPVISIIYVILFEIGYLFSAGLSVSLAILASLIMNSFCPISYHSTVSLGVLLYGSVSVLGVIIIQGLIYLITRISFFRNKEIQNDSMLRLNGFEKERFIALMYFSSCVSLGFMIFEIKGGYIIFLLTLFLFVIYLWCTICEIIINYFIKILQYEQHREDTQQTDSEDKEESISLLDPEDKKVKPTRITQSDKSVVKKEK